VTVAVGKRDVFDGIGLGNVDAIPVASSLSHRLQRNKACRFRGLLVRRTVQSGQGPRNFKEDRTQ
jgi:hypothetical protein